MVQDYQDARSGAPFAKVGQNVLDTAQAFGAKALDKLGAPQRAMARGFSQMAGLPAKQTSEANFQQLVDLVPQVDAQKHPYLSAAENVLKAGAVAGAEVAADPLAAIPFAKIGKAASEIPKLRELAEAAKNSGALQNAAKIFGGGTVTKVLKPEVVKAAEGAAERAKVLEHAANGVKSNMSSGLNLVTTESSQAAPTYIKLAEAGAAQDARTGAAKVRPPKNELVMGRDVQLTNEALQKAQETGATNVEAFVRNYAKARGGFKP
jgi:hypothetical protein